jgi:hypothetical protein
LEQPLAKLREVLSLRNPATRQTLLIGGAFILGFIVLGILGIQSWEYSNSVAFCSDTCHNVHPEEPAAFQDSYHARVKCTECHMGRVGTLQSILLKITHFRHLPEVLTGNYGRPTRSETLRPANESCERCHWPPAFHGDTVREITHYLPDEENTEKRTYLILKTGGGERERGLGFGIHWHIENEVEFIAADERNQEIPWVRTMLPDGRVVEYTDVTNPLPGEVIDEAEIKTMDCVDCHNRVGHPFPPPQPAIDEAISENRISSELPFIKRELSDLLTADYPDQQTALLAAEEKEADYRAALPEVVEEQPAAVDQAFEVADQLLTRLIFEKPGITWESFPDNSQHRVFAGCFRCHDGKHFSPEGESIRLHCNICHSIPLTVGEGDRTPQMPVATVQEPEYHRAPNFMADHRFQANEDCVECHGEVDFGSDDSSFCSNSACHGQAWPEVQLDANFVHPIELVGQHAQVWCHECHEGVEKPVYVCENCHEPPSRPHFGEVCEDCHTPEGFTPAQIEDFEHPIPLVGAHAALDCQACHREGLELTYDCAECHEPPSEPHFGDACQDCHTPEGFASPDLSGFQHPVPLEGAHAAADCMACHQAGFDLQFECAACHEPPTDHFEASCDTCHTPEGWVASATSTVAAAPEVPHPVEGLGDCYACHDPAGGALPAPGNHEEYSQAQCQICHTPGDTATFTPPEIPHSTEGLDDCFACHDPDDGSVPAPSHHAGFSQALCQICHEPGEVTTSLAPEIPHAIEGLDDCFACHDPDDGSVPAPSNHADYSQGQCQACHTLGEETRSVAPQIPHSIEGLNDCFLCHNPDGGSVPAPSNHADYSQEQCQNCHTREEE